MGTILMDCDGVLTDFTEAAIRVISKVTGTDYNKTDITEWDIKKSLRLCRDAWNECVEKFCSPGFCASIPVYDYTYGLLHRLDRLGDVTIVTTPMCTVDGVHSDVWMRERRDWMLDNLIDAQVMNHVDLVFADDKSHIIGDIFVDDKYDNVLNWKRHNGNTAILWLNQHNRNEAHRWGSVDNSEDLIQIVQASL